MKIIVEFFDIVVSMLVQTHLDLDTERTAAAATTTDAFFRLEKLVPLIQDGILVYELLEAPVIRLAESIHRVLHVDIVALVFHNAKHHLYLHRLVAHVLEKNGEEVLAVGARSVRVENEPPHGRLLAGRLPTTTSSVGCCI